MVRKIPWLTNEVVVLWTGFLDQEKDAAPVWWLESSSYPIEILDKKKVKVLVRSNELKKRYKHDPVIISFEYGKGVVYHMISHFYLQRSETRTQKQGESTCNSHMLQFYEGRFVIVMEFNAYGYVVCNLIVTFCKLAPMGPCWLLIQVLYTEWTAGA